MADLTVQVKAKQKGKEISVYAEVTSQNGAVVKTVPLGTPKKKASGASKKKAASKKK